jgi:hypothetical protein
VRPPPPLLKLRSWQYSLRSRIHKIKPFSYILPSAKPPVVWKSFKNKADAAQNEQGARAREPP